MLVCFVIIFILSSHLIHFVKANVHLLEDRKPSAISAFCNFYHALLLVLGIYYLGWLFGTILFFCHFFSLIRLSVTWIFDVPVIFLQNKNQTKPPLLLIETIFNLSFPMVIIAIFFTIISFYENQFNSMYIFLQNNIYVLIYAGIVVAVLSITRIIVDRKMNKYQ